MNVISNKHRIQNLSFMSSCRLVVLICESNEDQSDLVIFISPTDNSGVSDSLHCLFVDGKILVQMSQINHRYGWNSEQFCSTLNG